MSKESLIAGLNNEPQNYAFTGQIRDLESAVGYCACGHSIRYEFVVKHVTTKDVKVLGSSCINYYSEYRADDAKKMIASHKEFIQKEKTKKEEAELLVVKSEHDKFYRLMKRAYATYSDNMVRAPRSLWEIAESNKWRVYRICMKNYAQVNLQIKWYVKNTAEIKRVFEEIGITEESILVAQKHRQQRAEAASDSNLWLIEALKKVDKKGKGSFLISMILSLEQGRELWQFSPRQIDAMRRIFVKSVAGQIDSERIAVAERYFYLREEQKLIADISFADYKKQRREEANKPVNASKGLETNGLPF